MFSKAELVYCWFCIVFTLCVFVRRVSQYNICMIDCASWLVCVCICTCICNGCCVLVLILRIILATTQLRWVLIIKCWCYSHTGTNICLYILCLHVDWSIIIRCIFSVDILSCENKYYVYILHNINLVQENYTYMAWQYDKVIWYCLH